MKNINATKLKEFFTNDIWEVKLEKFPGWQRGAIKLLRIVLMSVKDFKEKNLELRATSLTLYSLLSIVPVIAMIFGIAQGFGLEQYLDEQLNKAFKSQPVILENMLTYVHNILGSAKGGIIAGFGFILLLWSVLQVLSSIEDSFNSIWYVKTARTWTRKFTDYLSIMMLAPIFIVLSGVLNVLIATKLQLVAAQLNILGEFISQSIVFCIQLLPYLTTSVLFFLLYMVLPNTRVKPKAAWYAGIVAGVVFQVFQWGYIEFQIGVSRYNAIYGSFASIPLFITWLQISWMIVLIGAEISYSVQNVTNFESFHRNIRINQRMRQLYSIYILRYIAQKFNNAQAAPDLTELNKTLDLPAGMIKQLVNEMQECNLIASNLKNNLVYYVPAVDLRFLTLNYITTRLQMSGGNTELECSNNDFEKVKNAYADFTEQVNQSNGNKNILEI
jgi:membrane protein